MADQIWLSCPLSKERVNGDGRWRQVSSQAGIKSSRWKFGIDILSSFWAHWYTRKGGTTLYVKKYKFDYEALKIHIFHAFCHCVLRHTNCRSTSICQCQSHVIPKQWSNKKWTTFKIIVHFYSNCSWVLLFYTYRLLIVISTTY